MTMTTRQVRRGMTLIELLIVMAIISMLAALTAGAVFRIKETQEKSFTETTLRKLGSILDQHWKAVVDSAKQEYNSLPNDIKQNLIVLADNTTAGPGQPKPHPRRDDRARLLYIKFRLKQEFPVAFSQVLTEGTTPTGATVIGPDRMASPSPLFLKSSTTTDGSGKLFTAKPTYFNAVYRKALPPQEREASILLVMALEQPRGNLPSLPLEQVVGSRFIADEGGYRYLIDAWGSPLQFFIFPAYPLGSGTSTTDLDILREKSGTFDIAKENQDPQDPERLLLGPTYSGWTGSTVFTTLLHPQFAPPPKLPEPAIGMVINRRMVPIIVSTGPDRDLGGNVPANNNAAMILTGPGAYDNIYSYRLRQTGARGD